MASGASIFLSGLFFFAAVVLWGLDCWRSRSLRLEAPSFSPFLLVFCAAVGISIAFSVSPLTSVVYVKKLFKLFLVYLIFTYFTRRYVELTFQGTLSVLGLSACYAILQYFWLLEVDLLNRVDGFMSHWMTLAGQLMLASVALGGWLALYPRQPIGATPGATGPTSRILSVLHRKPVAAGLLAVLLFALLLTLTRSAVLGCAAGMLVVLGAYSLRSAAAGVGALLLGFLLLPAGFQERFSSSFDPLDTTNRVRLELWQTGVNILQAHPVTGIGPRMVSRSYEDFRVSEEFPGWAYQHLHGNFIQIAAEMGLLTLAAWLALWVWIIHDLFRRARRLRAGPGYALAVSGCACLAAFLVAGAFEYNFGDSEILILLLFLITAPYVAFHHREENA